MVHFNAEKKPQPIPEYAQYYDLPKERGGILVQEIPCPICPTFQPFIQHDARVELHWLGGDGYMKIIACDKSGTYWREL